MIGRVTAIEKIAQYLVDNESTSARKVAAEICTIYEQAVMLQRESGHAVTANGSEYFERYVTPMEVGNVEVQAD